MLGMGADARRRPAPIAIPPTRFELDLSANTSIRHGKPKGKIDLTFFVFYNCLRSAPPISQSSAAAGSTRAASATAASAATSGSAERAGFSQACHVERATPATFAACTWLRLQSLRQCFKRPLMVCRYSAIPRRVKRGLCVYTVQHLRKKLSCNLSPTRRRRQKRPFCHSFKPFRLLYTAL